MVAILDIGTERLLQFYISMLPQYLPPSIGSIWLTFGSGKQLKVLKMVYRIIIILAKLHLNVALIPLTQFCLYLTYGFGTDLVWRFSRWPWRPSWISERNDLSNSKFLPPSFTQIRFNFREQLAFKDFQDGRHGVHLWYRNGAISAVLNLHVARCLPPCFISNWHGLRGDVVATLISERNDFSYSESPCHPNASKQVWVRPTWRSGADMVFRLSSVAAILHIGMERF